MLEKRLLGRVKPVVPAQTLDGEHPLTGDLGSGRRGRTWRR